MNTLKLLRKAFAITALPLLLATAATTQIGCLGHAGPTEVAQGKKFESGDPTYDQFFAAVHDLQLEMGTAPDKEAKLRLSLGKDLGVEPEEEDAPAPAQPAAAPKAEANVAATPGVGDAMGDQLKQSAINAVPGGAQYQAAKAQVEQAKQTVNQLKSIFGGGSSDAPAAAAKPAAPVKKAPKPPSATLIAKALKKKSEKLGLEMKLNVDRNGLADGEGSAELLLGSQEPASDAKDLADKVEKTAKAEIELIRRMKKAQKKLEMLEKLESSLEANVNTTFRTSRAKMSEVSKNLSDSSALIKLMTTRAQDVDKKAQAMLARLEEAASADIQKPGDEAKKDAVATNSEPTKDETQAADDAKKEEAAAKARAEDDKRRDEIKRAKKDAADREAEAKKLKKELAEKEAEAKRAKREVEKKEKAGPRQTSSAKPSAPSKSAMAGDFEP